LGINAGIFHITGDNNLYLHNEGVDGENNTIRLGSGNTHTRTFIAAIRGRTTEVNNAIPVYIDSESQLGTLSSSRRYKTDIKPMDKASEAILALKPVSFRYKVHKDTTSQFGLIAKEVAEVNPDLVVRDEKGDAYTVRYDAVNAMLLNEFLKEHRKVDQQEATITRLKSTVAQQQKDFQATVAQLTARLDEQASQIRKVSAQLELNKPAPQTVKNTD
jgi:hypothetical protein